MAQAFVSSKPPSRPVSDHRNSDPLLDAVRHSNASVQKAKTRPASFLTEQSSTTEWQAPLPSQDLEQEVHPGLSGLPQWDEMLTELKGFESSLTTPGTSARSRTACNVLRNLLNEVAVQEDAAARAARLAAAHNWWSRHRPRDAVSDPPAVAASAVSLSIAAPTGNRVSRSGCRGNSLSWSVQQLVGTPQRKSASGTIGTGRVSISGAIQQPGGQRWTAAFSKAPQQEMKTSAASKPARAALPAPEACPPISRLAAVSPVHLNSHRKHTTTAASDAPLSGSHTWGSLQAVGPVFAPKAAARVVFDPDGPSQAPLPNTQGKSPSWFQGPFKAYNNSQAGPQYKLPPSKPYDQDDTHKPASPTRCYGATDVCPTAHVDQMVAAWSKGRARLEEEIVRRQEASRYAMPSTWLSGDGPAAAADSLSAYAGMSMQAPGNTWSSGPSSNCMSALPNAAPGLVPCTTIAAAATAERTNTAQEYEHDSQRILDRLAQLGLEGRISADALHKALAPVPDKPYLQCMTRLPRPGEYLEARPGSVRAGNSRKNSGRKSKAGPKNVRPPTC